MIYLLAFLLGAVAGLRTMTAPAATAWAVHLWTLDLRGSWLGTLGEGWALWMLTAMAVGELLVDKVPSIPSRTEPLPFLARLLSGALSGAALGVASGTWIGGAMAGVTGAVGGTLGGYAFRSRLAGRLGKDLPAALVEDVVAVGGAALIVLALR